MSIVTAERAAEIRAELCEKHGATWLHEYAGAIEAEVAGHYAQVLEQIYELAHHKSTGPAVPDTYWEIRNIAQEAL